jgi:hypothetical protein
MKEVKIIGLSVNKKLGILNACQLKFDENNRLIIIKGGVGEGKTTLQKSIQIGTQGTKVLTDKKLYGEVDTETQLLDGVLPVYVGCKSDPSGSLIYSIYIKDQNDKIVKNPVIDGVSATPAKYLEALQTELTWKMDELCSENPTIQKNILLQLYKYDLAKLGVIFDSKNPKFKESILGKLEIAQKIRDEKDSKRKELGGIREDLEAKGYKVDQPDTCPIREDLSKLELQEKEVEKQKTISETTAQNSKSLKLSELSQKAAEISGRCLILNNELKSEYEAENKQYLEYTGKVSGIDETKNKIYSYIQILVSLDSFNLDQAESYIDMIDKNAIYPEKINEPTEPKYITLDSNNKVTNVTSEGYSGKSKKLIDEIIKLRMDFINENNAAITIDTTEFDNQLNSIAYQKSKAKEINKICDAIDSFHAWRESNEAVMVLRNEYQNLLKQVNTGVSGLEIIAEDSDLFLKYNGEYDTKYFNNPEKEMRKLSSYSGTQKPVICLLIQNYLLSLKPKALRYMYIDNVPIDNKTRSLIEKMCEDLELRVFLNITGDFDQTEIKDGEILIEGGEVFFK